MPATSDLTMSLLSAPMGRTMTVSEVSGPPDAVIALEEIGIRSGVSLKVLRRAPFGCPLVVAVAGARFALRCDSVRRIQVHRDGV